MNRHDSDIYQPLKEKGYKITPARKVMIDIFNQSPNQLLNAADLYELIKKLKFKTNFSTVYRNLEVLADTGILEKINIFNGIKYKLREVGPFNHYMICTSCHKTESLPYCPLGDLETSLKKGSGFFPTEHQVLIYGYCRNCHANT